MDILPNNLTAAQLKKLKYSWYTKLKASGYKDIEKWNMGTTLNNSKGDEEAIFMYRLKTTDKLRIDSTEEYFRCLSLWAQHSPDVPSKYKAILLKYSQDGNLNQTIKDINPKIHRPGLVSYIRDNIPKIIAFVNTLEDSHD